LAFHGSPIRRFGQHLSEAPLEQRIAHSLGSELHGEGDEPGRLPGPWSRPRHRGVLLEERELERTLGRKLPVDRALGESGSLSDFVQRDRVEAALSEERQASLDQPGSSFRLTALSNDTHRNLRYAFVSLAASKSGLDAADRYL